MTPPTNGVMEHVDDIDKIKRLPEGEWRALLYTELRGLRNIAREEALVVYCEERNKLFALAAILCTGISTVIGIIAMVLR